MVKEKRSMAWVALNLLSANLTKWSTTLKKISRLLPMICLTVSGHFVGLALEGSI